MATDKFEFESIQDSETIRAFMESLMRGLEREHLVLSTGADRIEFAPCGALHFTVRGRRKNGACKVSLKLEWKESAVAETGGKTLSVVS